jgi:hypothetical protein
MCGMQSQEVGIIQSTQPGERHIFILVGTFPKSCATLTGAVVGIRWSPFDAEGQAARHNKLTNVWVEALRKLAPNTGAYINEVFPSHITFDGVKKLTNI